MLRSMAVMLAMAPLGIAGPAPDDSDRLPSETFLVTDKGCALLGPHGEEIERLESTTSAAGAISPDGRRVAFSRSRPVSSPAGRWKGELVIRSLGRPQGRATVPLVWGDTGSSLLPCWSGDGKRLLICERGHNREGTRGSAYRVYELGTEGLITLKLPEEWWPSDWSPDGKRLLVDARRKDGAVGVSWANIDGTGEPVFINPADEEAFGARLSPDGRKILCMAVPGALGDDRGRPRLSVIDLSTQVRTVVDEPGETHGHCWSSDGSRIAYTSQRSLENPAVVAVRETFLMTCGPDGSDRKTVTSRKYEVPENSSGRDGTTIFVPVHRCSSPNAELV